MATLCINPDCPRPQNSDENILFCLGCGSELLLAGRYRTTALLSDKGGFGNTYKVTHNGDAKVLKVLTNNQPKAVQLFEQEYRVLNQLNHPGIPQGEHYFTFFPRNSQTPLYCLVMEYIRGMDLEEYQKNREMRPIEQKLALEWLLQLAQILDAVHGEQFFHRDIKPSNIILKPPDGQLVLIDFGGVRQVTATIMAGGLNTAIYTPGYAPPEQEQGYAVLQSDFYALGRTMVYLLTGKQPTAPELYNPNTDEFLWRKEAPELSAQLGDFIDKLMARSASNRPADTRVILQELDSLQRHLYPPKVRQPSQPGNTGVPSTIPINPLYPPKVRQPSQPGNTGVLSTIPINPPSGKGPSPGSPQKTRRGFLKVTAGLAGGGLVTAVVGRQLFRNGSPPVTPRPAEKPSPMPSPNTPSASGSTVEMDASGSTVTPRPAEKPSLLKFSFDVATVNSNSLSRGTEIDRQRLQAEYFRQSFLGNGVTLDMVSIPGGTFMMGSPASEEGRDSDEGPQHRRTIAPFFMGKFAVTQAQWQAVMNANPSYFRGENLPVDSVNWNEAVEFCQRLSRQTGRDYRLPSEAEWEYACRAGTTTPFHFGKTIATDLANYNGNNSYADEPKGIYREKTTPVGSFGVANAFGLYDMHGNVWEWCADPWHKNYRGAPSDGRVWESGGNDSRRMLRGGSWFGNSRLCRSALRNSDGPGLRYAIYGLRVVCVFSR